MTARIWWNLLLTGLIATALYAVQGTPVVATVAACLALMCLLELWIMQNLKKQAIREAIVEITGRGGLLSRQEVKDCLEMISNTELEEALWYLVSTGQIKQQGRYFHVGPMGDDELDLREEVTEP